MRIRALVVRIIRQFLRDKRSLALMMLAPMLILLLMKLVFSGDTYSPKIAAVQLPAPFIQQLEQNGADVREMSLSEANAAMQKHELDAVISLDSTAPEINLEGSDPSINRQVMMIIQKVQQNMNTSNMNAKPVIHYLHGSQEMSLFDNIGPVLIGVFAFFFVFLLSGVSFLRERTGGTLERLLATPLRRWEVVLGYAAGFGIFAIAQACLIAWFSISLLDMMMTGSFWLVLIITFMLAISALTLGTFLSAFANNEFQMVQFIPLVIVPQVFFCGLFNLETIAEWLRWISYLMPLRYGADALRSVMIRGQGWSDISTDIYILLGFSILFMTANAFALKKHRRI